MTGGGRGNGLLQLFPRLCNAQGRGAFVVAGFEVGAVLGEFELDAEHFARKWVVEFSVHPFVFLEFQVAENIHLVVATFAQLWRKIC